jgi:hypothetical protein
VGGWGAFVTSKILIRICVGCFLQDINYGTLDIQVFKIVSTFVKKHQDSRI